MKKRTKKGLALLLSLLLVLSIGVTAFATDSLGGPPTEDMPAAGDAALLETADDLTGPDIQLDDPLAAVAVLGFDGYAAAQVLPFGAEESAVVLPGAIKATAEGQDPIDVAVTWTLQEAAFDGAAAGAVYTYVGAPVIPEGYSWNAALVAAPVVTATVGEDVVMTAEEDDEDVITYTVISFNDATADLAELLPYETPYATVQAKLPKTMLATVESEIDGSITTTTETNVEVPVVWTCGDYDNKVIDHPFTFTAALADAETYTAGPGLAMPTAIVKVGDKPAGRHIDDPSVKSIKIIITYDANNKDEYEGDPDNPDTPINITIDFGTPSNPKAYVAMDIEGKFELSNMAKDGLNDGDWSNFAWIPDFPVDWSAFVPIELYAELPAAEGGGVEKYHLATLTVGSLVDEEGDPHDGMRPIIITYRDGALQLDNVNGEFKMNFSLSRELAEERDPTYKLDLDGYSYIFKIDLDEEDEPENEVVKEFVVRYRASKAGATIEEKKNDLNQNTFDRLQWRVDVNLKREDRFSGKIVDEITSGNHKFTTGSKDEVVVYTLKDGVRSVLGKTYYTVTVDGTGKFLTIQLDIVKLTAADLGPADYAYSADIVSTVVDGLSGSGITDYKGNFTNKVTAPYKDSEEGPSDTDETGSISRLNDDKKSGTLSTGWKTEDGDYYVRWTMDINRNGQFTGDAHAASVILTEQLGANQALFDTFTFKDSKGNPIESVQLYTLDTTGKTEVVGTENKIKVGTFNPGSTPASGVYAETQKKDGIYSTLLINRLNLQGQAYRLIVYARVTDEVAARSGLTDSFSYIVDGVTGGKSATAYFPSTSGNPGLAKAVDKDEKGNQKIDWDKQEVDWTITLSPQGQRITNLIFEDVFGDDKYSNSAKTYDYTTLEGKMKDPAAMPTGTSLALLPGTLTVKLAPVANGAGSIELVEGEGKDYQLVARNIDDGDFKTGFIIKLKNGAVINGLTETTTFENGTTDPTKLYNIVITYKTKFELNSKAEDGIGMKGYKFINAVNAQFKMGKNTDPTARYAAASVDLFRDELKGNGRKTGTLVTEDGVSTIDWAIHFNTYNRDDLSEKGTISIRDPITNDQRIKDLKGNGSNLADLVTVKMGSTVLKAGIDYTIKALTDSQGFEIVFDKQPLTNEEYIITYTTELIGAVKSSYKNTASAYLDEECMADYTAEVGLKTEDTLFYKSGKTSGAYIVWNLAINKDYDLSTKLGADYDPDEGLKDLSIVDTLSAGQLFINSGLQTLKIKLTDGEDGPETLLTAFVNSDTKWDYRVDVVDDQDLSVPPDPRNETTTITITFHDNFTLGNEQRLDVEYYSQVDRGSLPKEYIGNGNIATVFNSARFTASQYAYQNSITQTVVASGGSGGGRGEKYKLRVEKVDAADNTLYLEGAEFNIYNSSGHLMTLTPKKTNAEGWFEIELLAGTYYVKEVVAPAGYDVDPSSASATSLGREVKVPGTTKNSEGATVETFKNSKITYTIQVRKQNSENTSQVLSGAVFDLYTANGTKVLATKTTGANGIAKFTGLLPGEYRLVETQAPAGYNLPADNTIYVTVKDAPTSKRVVTVTVNNTPIPTDPVDPDPEDPAPPPIIVRPEVDPDPDPDPVPPVIVVPDPPEDDDPGEPLLPAEMDTPTGGDGLGAEDLGPGGIPLGGLGSIAWSLLNFMMSVIALLSAIVLIVTMFKRKKVNQAADEESGEEPDENVKRNRLTGLRVLTILAGFIPGILFLILENIRLPMVWITRWTPIIGAFFIISMILVLLHALLKKRAKTVGDEDESKPTNLSQQTS